MKAASFLALVLLCSNALLAQTDPSTWTERLVGTWVGQLGEAMYTEVWQRAGEGQYDGTATMTKDGNVLSTEKARIILFADQWIYLAAPGGQGVTCFNRILDEGGTWTFENAEHDFPKRVGYALNGDSLTAWIAGGTDTEDRMQFDLLRVRP